MGRRIAPIPIDTTIVSGGSGDVAYERDRFQRMMFADAGVLRDHASLASAIDDAVDVAHRPADDVASAELRNLATLGAAVATAAQLRTETRGAHTRTDHPAPDDDLEVRLVIGG